MYAVKKPITCRRFAHIIAVNAKGHLYRDIRTKINMTEEREYYATNLTLSNAACKKNKNKFLNITETQFLHHIDDISGSRDCEFSKEEKVLRCKLASLYRIVDLYEWTQQIFNHITVKVDKDKEQFLINQFGLTYREVTAGNLVKIDLEGDVVDADRSNDCSVNKAGFVIHSAIHAGRPEINCVIHVHLPDVIAVSAMNCGLLLLSQESCLVGNVSYHDYQGIALDEKEREDIVKDLGPVNKVMLLRNHGMVVCGETIEDAFFYLVNMIDACKTQVKILSCVKLKDLKVLDKSIMEDVQEAIKNKAPVMTSNEHKVRCVKDMAFEAEMRRLDDLGHITGYSYVDRSTIGVEDQSSMKKRHKNDEIM